MVFNTPKKTNEKAQQLLEKQIPQAENLKL